MSDEAPLEFSAGEGWIGARVRMSRDGIAGIPPGGPLIPWTEVASVSRTTVDGRDAITLSLREGGRWVMRRLSPWRRLVAALTGGPRFHIEKGAFSEHVFGRMLSFALLYHGRYGATSVR